MWHPNQEPLAGQPRTHLPAGMNGQMGGLVIGELRAVPPFDHREAVRLRVGGMREGTGHGHCDRAGKKELCC